MQVYMQLHTRFHLYMFVHKYKRTQYRFMALKSRKLYVHAPKDYLL